MFLLLWVSSSRARRFRIVWNAKLSPRIHLGIFNSRGIGRYRQPYTLLGGEAADLRDAALVYTGFHTACNHSLRCREATGVAHQHPRATSCVPRTRRRILADLLSLISAEEKGDWWHREFRGSKFKRENFNLTTIVDDLSSYYNV